MKREHQMLICQWLFARNGNFPAIEPRDLRYHFAVKRGVVVDRNREHRVNLTIRALRWFMVGMKLSDMLENPQVKIGMDYANMLEATMNKAAPIPKRGMDWQEKSAARSKRYHVLNYSPRTENESLYSIVYNLAVNVLYNLEW